MGHRYTPPSPADLRPGGRYGQHVLADRRAEFKLRHDLVKAVFAPQPLFPGWPCPKPGDPRLVRHLRDHAPRRGSAREAWLRRADELCRAWGRPLFGPRGLAACHEGRA